MSLKKRILAMALAVQITLQALLFCSCGRPRRFTAQSFAYFDTVTTIVGYAKSKAEFDRVSEEILASLAEYHRLFTIYERYEGLENLCSVNETVNGAHRTVTVDGRILDMLLFAREMHELTAGRVNVAMGSVLSLWHDKRQAASADPSSASLPSVESLQAASAHTDIGNLQIDRVQSTVTLTDPEMTLDVGAVAKGYAVEMTARTLESRGVTGYLLNVGGNVRAVGPKGDGAAWIAGIEDPDPQASGYLAQVALVGSLVTSGSYQRYYEVDGRRYHHIIDPETGMPAERYTSVSVLCASSALGDALSTALFCMPLAEGMALVDSLDGVEAMWVTSEGERHRTDGFPR